MPSKTISLEVDAYERLKATRIRGESFSAVVRRITLPPPKATAAERTSNRVDLVDRSNGRQLSQQWRDAAGLPVCA
jgi:hypothetical protein